MPSTTPAEVSATTGRERGYPKGRARRQQIIDVAAELYGENGYRGTSLRDVAAKVGLTHPGVLHHFPTKEALLLAVLEHRDLEDTGRFTDVGGRGVAILRLLVDLAALNQSRPHIVELFAVLSAEAISAEHPAHDYFQNRYEHSIAGVTRAFAQAREDGALREGVDPDVAGRRVVALMDGLQIQWLYRPATVDMADELREAIDDLLTKPLASAPAQDHRSIDVRS